MMTNKQDIKKNPWQFIDTFFKRKLTILQIGANLAGAGIVTFYFMFFSAVKSAFKTGGKIAVTSASVAKYFA